MSDDEIEAFVEEVMVQVRECSAYDTLSKEDSRRYLRGIIAACRVELEALRHVEHGDDEEDDSDDGA